MDGSRPRASTKDAAQLQQLQRHKLHLLDLNRRHLTAMTQLEAQLADQKALLQLRERELGLIRTCDGEEDKELEGKISLLEAENQRLRRTISVNSDIEGLKAELAQALALKRQYEEEFKAATLHSLILEQEDTNMSPINDSQEAQTDLQTALSTLAQAQEERDYLRNELIPAFERSIRMHESEKKELETKVEELRGKHHCETPEIQQIQRPKTTMKTQADQERAPQVTFQRPKSSLSPKQQNCIVSQGKLLPRTSIIKRSSLTPKPPAASSVIRTKKAEIQLLKTQETMMKEDSFADEFPEESELM